MVMSFSKLRELVIEREAWYAAVHEAAELDMTEWLNRAEQILIPIALFFFFFVLKELHNESHSKSEISTSTFSFFKIMLVIWILYVSK